LTSRLETRLYATLIKSFRAGEIIMTAQISDSIIFNSKKYSISALENELHFHPEDYGLKPKAPSSANWRGYYSTYSFSENNLILSQLKVGIDFENRVPMELFNVIPSIDVDYWKYSDLRHPIPYTGRMIICRSFINDRSLYVHMGFHRPHCYKEVLELQISNGRLLEFCDHSDLIEIVRDQIKHKKFIPDLYLNEINHLGKFVSASFGLDFETKWKIYER